MQGTKHVDNSNIWRGNALRRPDALSLHNGDFKIRRRGRQLERQKKKTIGLISKTTTSHVHHTFFVYISFPFLRDYDVKMPNFTFYRGRKQATTKFYFSFRAWIWSLEIQLRGGFAYIWQSKWLGIIAIKTERADWKNANSLFKRRSSRLRVVGS